MGVGRAQRPANWVFCCQERYRQRGRRRWPRPPVSTCDHPHRNRRQPRPTGSDSGRAPRLSPPLATSGADYRSQLLAGMLAAAHGVPLAATCWDARGSSRCISVRSPSAANRLEPGSRTLSNRRKPSSARPPYAPKPTKPPSACAHFKPPKPSARARYIQTAQTVFGHLTKPNRQTSNVYFVITVYSSF